jgi:threonine dehydrogenase-like Zn-dependent dehydrogenase
MAQRHGVTTHDLTDSTLDELLEHTDGRGPDAVVDAVGTEAHGATVTSIGQAAAGLLPDAVARPTMLKLGVDRLAALHDALAVVRRGGTVSLAGVYVGEVDPMPMRSMFDKQVTLRMGQCNVKRWIDDLLPLVEDPADPLGVLDLVTHRAPLADAAEMYELFQKKEDGCIKVVLTP